MKTYLFILMWFLIPKKLSVAENPNPTLNQYFQRQSKIINEKLVKEIRNIRQTNTKSESPQILGTYKHKEEILDPNVNIYTFFNKTFFAIEHDIFLGNLNKTFEMDFYGHFKHKRPPHFFKTIEYQQIGFMALGIENEILIYTFAKNSIVPDLIQRVHTAYSSDCIFFINTDSLYFVSSTNRGEHIGLITFYKWLGSYFDQIETVYAIGAIKMDSFVYKNSEIIMVGQSIPENVKVQSSIYEFKQEQVRKIQQLDTNKPTHMDLFFENMVPYVLIYEELNSQKLYKWNGFEMVLVNRFQWEHKVDKSIVVYSNTIPLIVQPQLDKVLIYKPQNEDIQLYQTKGYLANYSVILDINKGENENGNITFIVGLNGDNIINIYGMSFKAHVEMEREEEGGTLRNCFNNVELKVYDHRKKLNQMSNSLVDVPIVDKVVSSSRKRQVTLSSNADVSNIENSLDAIKSRLNTVRPFIIDHEGSSNQLVVNGKAIIKGNIVTKKMKANKLKFTTVNGRNWTPEQWLRYKQEQTIKGPVKTNKISTRVLVANGGAAILFQNLLRNSGEQHLNGNIKINNLFASKMFAKRINNIEVDDIYKQSDTIKMKGIKSFENIIAKKAEVTRINGMKTEDILSMVQTTSLKSMKTFANHVTIENMDVESIDQINWVEFEKSVFKIGEDSFIHGNLTGPAIKTTNLQTKYLNGVDTDHLMTKSTDQIINSSIEFNNINASSIKCGSVNDIDITKSVQIDQNGTVIKGHVIIDDINVLHDLELQGTTDKLFSLQGDHIFGTNESDLLQRYLGKVLINGNLYVNNFSTLQNTSIFLGGNKYTIDVLNEYWNKNGNQTIPVHFEATNGISTPHLNTKSLNEVPIEKFASNNKNSQIKSPLFFENVIVGGNVILKKDSANNSFDLKKLASEGVRINDSTYTLKGKKVFTNSLVVKHLKTRENSSRNIENASPKEPTGGIKTFKKVIIKGNLTSNIHSETVNDINISKYLETLLPLHKPQNLTSIEFKKVTVENLQVKNINGYNIAEYLAKLQNILENKHIKAVHVKGSVIMKQILDLRTINGHDIDNLFTKKDTPDLDKEADLTGDVEYTGKVNIGNLKAKIINEINFPDLTKRFFYKESNQTVTGIYTFTNLKTVHLYAHTINDKNVINLIDISLTKPQQITAPNGIIFNNISFEKSVNAEKMIPCDINKAMERLRYPETQEWAAVEISGNVTFLDADCDLIQILEKSVKTDQENVICAPVIINGHSLTTRVKTKGNLNGINLIKIMDDAVLNDSDEEQVITGHKIFNNVIDASIVTVIENADIPIVNQILIPELYNRIIKQEEVNNITILGKKSFFGGLQSNIFLTKKIAGIEPENIVSLTNLKQIPSALFDSIHVNNDMNVKLINSYELDYILNNRIFTNTTEKQVTNAVYFFNDLEITDNLRTPTINNIEIKDVVFDLQKQKIIGPKRFLQNITILGNVSVGYLNGINITEAYNNAILHGKNEVINGSITFLNPVRLQGNITAQTINGYPIEQIKKIMNQTLNKAEEMSILNITGKVKTLVQDSLPEVKHMPNEFMYIEKSENLQIEIQNAIDARVTMIKDYALIHILSEESHENCNLPEGCKCPVQHTVEISPHLSVSYFLNKQQQRIYSYDDDTMTIHLMTNSISTNTQCRTNDSEKINEVSTMTWSTTSTKNTKGAFSTYPILFTGYISGAEFFSLHGVTYGLIARYYDPVADSHDLDCIVIRFSDDKTSASEIQRIPTQGVWTLYLLHTAQGVTVVIGNLAKQPYTEIHRFNEEIEEFELLRSVSYGCTKAVGVVLGTDSLIILANKDTPLQVLKYQPNGDNYYYYQMFALDEAVLGMSVFYVGGFGISEAYLCIVTEENYRIYSFQYIDGWKLESKGTIRGLKNLIPFELNNQLHLFAPSTGESSLLRVVKQGMGET